MDRYFSNLSKTNRIWHLKCFKNLGLFMIMKHICSWKHHLHQENDWHQRDSLRSFLAIWARNYSCLDCLMLCWTGQGEHTEKWMLNLPKCETVWWGDPASWKNLPDILQDTEKCDWQTAYIGRNVFEISCFIERSARYYGPVD